MVETETTALEFDDTASCIQMYFWRYLPSSLASSKAQGMKVSQGESKHSHDASGVWSVLLTANKCRKPPLTITGTLVRRNSFPVT